MDLYVKIYKKNKFETIYIKLALVLYVLYTLMPIVPRYVDSFIFAAIIMGLFFLFLLNHIEDFGFKKMLIYIPFVFLIILEIIFLLIYSNSVVYDLYDVFLMNLPVLLFLVVLDDKKLVKIIFYTAIFALVTTVITSSIFLYSDSDASRWLASVSDPNDPYFITLNYRNVGGFESIYTLTILIPFIIGLLKTKNINFFVFLGLIGLMFLNIYYSKYAIALIVAIIGIGFVLLPRIKSIKRMLTFFGVLIIGFILLKDYVADFLYYFANYLKFTDVSNKIRVIGDCLSGIENNTSNNTRFPLLEESIILIKENIWLGTIFTKGGINSGHSYILDTSLKYGVIGIAGIVSMYASLFVLLYKRFKDNKLCNYIILACIFAIVVSIVNPGNWYFLILFLIPCFGVYFQNRSIEKLTKNKILFIKIFNGTLYENSIKI